MEKVGDKFNRLKIIKLLDEVNNSGLKMCEALCDCGSNVKASISYIRRGKVKSCGCLQREAIKATCQTNKTHDKSRTKIYYVWRTMHKRCYLKSDKTYPSYGGRGIKVCERWNSFENFYLDMGEKMDGFSLDRIDNNDDYSPNNCRWATAKEQANNTRRNVLVEHEGEMMTLGKLSEILGIPRPTIYWRFKNGFRDEKLKQKGHIKA